jgi:hypothetical protein
VLNHFQRKDHRLDLSNKRSRVHFATKTLGILAAEKAVPKRGKQRKINMTTNQLARYYQTLTPWERLPLIVAACQRGDQVEEERVAGSAPRNGFRLPDFWGLAEGLNDLAQCYLLKQLDLAAFYWRFAALLEREPLDRPSRQERQRDERRWQLLKMLCYRYVVRADGWRLLCTELHVDPVALLKELPGYDTVQQMEQVARLLTFSTEEALAFLRADAQARRRVAEETPAVQPEGKIDTAADVAQSMHAFLQERLDEWR